MDKESIRREIKQQRKSLTEQEAYASACQIHKRLFAEEVYQKANTILTYVSQDREVDTIALMKQAWKDGKKVLIPKVYGNTMEFHKIDSFNETAPGAYGILEPVNPKKYDVNHGLIIMPGIAFDADCNRIGYGGGYYDEYISRHDNLGTVALAYEFQMVERIPVEAFDKRPEMIITECRIYRRVYS